MSKTRGIVHFSQCRNTDITKLMAAEEKAVSVCLWIIKNIK